MRNIMDIFRPTLKQIKDYLHNLRCGHYLDKNEESPMGWFYSVYVPRNLDTIYIGKETQEIIVSWEDVRKTFNLDSNYMNSLQRLKTDRISKTYNLMDFTDWFVLLAICVENNLIVDSVKLDRVESIIYDIEPSTPRLKVRIP